MTFELGNGSIKELQGVHPSIVKVVKRAVQLSSVDFSVHDGLRTLQEQKNLVAKGASKTMNSKHRQQSDGYGHAVDLVPYVNGKLRWEWPLIWEIASSVGQASKELGIPIVWGAIWDKNMSQYGHSIPELKAEVEKYKARHPGSDFLDGPHYQL